MKYQSPIRKLKRKTLKEKGLTFAQRLREAVAKGTTIQSINWQDKPDVRPR